MIFRNVRPKYVVLHTVFPIVPFSISRRARGNLLLNAWIQGVLFDGWLVGRSFVDKDSLVGEQSLEQGSAYIQNRAALSKTMKVFILPHHHKRWLVLLPKTSKVRTVPFGQD